MATEQQVRSIGATAAIFSAIAAVSSAVCAGLLIYFTNLQVEEQRKQTDYLAKQTTYMREQVAPRLDFESVVIHKFPSRLQCEIKGVVNRGGGGAEKCIARVCFQNADKTTYYSFSKEVGRIEKNGHLDKIMVPLARTVDMGVLPVSTPDYIKKNGVEVRLEYTSTVTQEQLLLHRVETKWQEVEHTNDTE
jgi:hypothetical protein